MDSGDFGRLVYDLPPFIVNEQTEYCAVYENYKHIASFKTRDKAIEYVTTLAYLTKVRNRCKDLL